MKFLKLFNTHTDYTDFLQSENFVKPNVSRCIVNNDVHYNPITITLTPKQLAEYLYSFTVSKTEKFFTYRQSHLDESIYSNTCEMKLSQASQKLNRGCGIRYRNLIINSPFVGDLSYYEENSEIFLLNYNLSFNGPTIRFDYQNEYVSISTFLYKRNEMYNGNDVFYITDFEITNTDAQDTSVITSLIQDFIFYGDYIVLLCPHGTYDNFVIAYTDGNGGYTTTKPSTITITPSLVNNDFSFENNWISMILFDGVNEEINTRVDNAINLIKSDTENFNGDFSALSVLDDIKIEVPINVYHIIKNPWKFFNENYIYNI